MLSQSFSQKSKSIINNIIKEIMKEINNIGKYYTLL